MKKITDFLEILFLWNNILIKCSLFTETAQIHYEVWLLLIRFWGEDILYMSIFYYFVVTVFWNLHINNDAYNNKNSHRYNTHAVQPHIMNLSNAHQINPNETSNPRHAYFSFMAFAFLSLSPSIALLKNWLFSTRLLMHWIFWNFKYVGSIHAYDKSQTPKYLLNHLETTLYSATNV